MAPDWKYKNHPAHTSLKEDLSVDTTFNPSYISWDTPFKVLLETVKFLFINIYKGIAGPNIVRVGIFRLPRYFVPSLAAVAHIGICLVIFTTV